MATTQRSPTLVVEQQSSSSLPFASPDLAMSTLSPSIPQQSSSDVSAERPDVVPEPSEQEHDTSTQNETQASQNGSATEETAADTNDGDDSSNSESNSESSTSTETPGTVSTPRSSAQDSGQPVPESSTTQLSAQSTDEVPSAGQEHSTADNEENTSTSIEDILAVPPPPPPIDVDIPIMDTTPEWVKHEEDTSTPDADELKEIESEKGELNAADTSAIERDVFTNLDDPDLRPSKKIRLSWIVKGVRGTRECPNRARIMTSPAVCIDGKYWSIKFFPRGNKSRNSLAVFVRCSPLEPDPASSQLEGSFRSYECAPDADLSKVEPMLDFKLSKPEVKDAPSTKEASSADNCSEAGNKPETSTEQGGEDDGDDDDDSISGDEGDRIRIPVKQVATEDFRVSAQLGLAIYNPDEPRTCYTSEASHQFYPHQDDWGWDPAVSQYEEIHRRKRGQRQALLRNDTLAIDAYILIYDDPTKALFWHASGGETQWDSKGLAGVFPMGTKLLYHSPATAGITAYSLLSPFRKAIQQIDVGAWRRDSSVRPRPLLAHLQLVLFQMRHMKKEELYVHLDGVIHEIMRSGESFDNVDMFWETFRRAIEIEADGEEFLGQSFAKIFGSKGFLQNLPSLPVKDVADFQTAANQAFQKAGIQDPLPDFLPLTLQRQSFDVDKRAWQLHNNRVAISEELDLSPFAPGQDGKYTLYGLVIHDGDRTSGKFFSVLRPAGPGGKWLAFSDGNGNKIFSYTKKRVKEYEGLEVQDLKRATSPRQTIHSAMYIRTSCLGEYLPQEMETFRLPIWLKQHLDGSYNHSDDIFEDKPSADHETPIRVEVFWDKIVGGQAGKLDLYKLKSNSKARDENYRQCFTSDREATISEIQSMVATQLSVDEKSFKLWGMNYHRLGGVSKGYMSVLRSTSMVAACLGTSEILTLWLSLVPGQHELDDDTLTKHFKSIGGKHVEAPPKPVIEPPKSPKLAEREAGEEPQETATEETTNQLENTTSQPPATGTSAREASLSVGDDPSDNATSTGNINREETVAEQIETAASPDAEQNSIREAVERHVQGTAPSSQESIAEIIEVEFDTGPNQSQTLVIPSTIAETSPSNEESNSATVVEITNSESPVQTTTVIPTEASLSTPDSPEIDPESVTLLQGTDSSSTDGPETDSGAPAVVHGHLFEALSHEGNDAPVGIPIAIGGEQIILVSPNQDDISAEDAALITSMIAADIEAAERDRQALNGEDNENINGTNNVDIDSRPSTPRQRIADIYGFLHVFDADEQNFTAHSTFMVPANTTISSMVRKQLKYDDDRNFHLWKRDGTYRTTGVSLESTFMDVSLSDCCEVIVGDHVGEKKMEGLKSEAKYVDPGQLMRYLAMVQRRHPVSARTSTEAVEIAEFGGDYYKGPLARGQRHGEKCSLITQSGDTYQGPLVAGQKSGGKGQMTYQNGDVYDGEWLDDQKHGQGEFVEKRTGNRYVGGYENDKRWGKGTTYWQVADQQAALCQVCYFEEVDALFYRCGHVVACYACAKQCALDSNGCPVCRKPIEAVVKMYRS